MDKEWINVVDVDKLMEQGNTSQLYVWDVRIPEEEGKNHNEIIKILWEIAKKWAFQKEKGELNGTVHWQMRLSFKKKLTKFSAMKFLHENYWPHCYVCPTSDKNKGNMFYVTKEETRIEGPWTDKSELKNKIPSIIREELPIDIQMIEKLLPWQEVLLKEVKENKLNFRTINWVFDEPGDSGKSTLSRWCMSYKIGQEIMIGGGYKDMIRMVYDVESVNHMQVYIIDMPRSFQSSMSEKEKFAYISAIEKIKSGYAYDDRHLWKDKLFDPPQVWIFSNWKPEISLLSKDRWRLWKLVGKRKDYQSIKLIPTSFEELEEKTPRGVKLVVGKIADRKEEILPVEDLSPQDIRPIWRGKVKRREV